MSKITIFSKASFSFGPGASRNSSMIDCFVTVPNSFQEMDEKYTEDPTFKLALRYGEVTVVEKKTAIPSVDSLGSVETVGSEVEEENDSEDKELEFFNNLKVAKDSEVKELAKKYGAIYDENDKLKNNKKRVFEAFKLSLGNE